MNHTPPLIARVAVRPKGKRGLSLWLPLFLVWPFAALFAALLLPFVFLYFLFVQDGLRKAGQFLSAGYLLLCSLRGLEVEVVDSHNEILVRLK